jgi:hypothetical protein
LSKHLSTADDPNTGWPEMATAAYSIARDSIAIKPYVVARIITISC